MFTRVERELTASEREELRRRIGSLRWEFPWLALVLLLTGAAIVVGSFVVVKNPNAGPSVFVAMLGVLGGAILAALAVMSWLSNSVRNESSRGERQAIAQCLEGGRVAEVEIEASAAWEVAIEGESEVGDDEGVLKALLRVSESSFVLIVDRSGQVGMEFAETLRSRFKVMVWPDGEVYRVEVEKSRPQIAVKNVWEEAGDVETFRAGGRLARFVELREDELPERWRMLVRS